MRTKQWVNNGWRGKQRGMSVIGMLLLACMVGVVVLVAMQVMPMYMQYYTIKSTIEGVRKEPQIAQMSPLDIQNAIQKRFDIGYVDKVQARELRIRNDRGGRVLDLVYDDERSLCCGLFVVLKVGEVISLAP